MSVTLYDPVDWLVSLPRSLGSYVASVFATTDIAPDVQIEMDFPDPSVWRKEAPLKKIIVHFVQDDIDHPPLGFGIQGRDTWDDVSGTYTLEEAAWHTVNYDMGVWASAESGGVTARAKTEQVLHSIFGTAGGRVALQEATGGIQVVSYTGGRNELDRVNDIPLWRLLNSTLIVRVFSKHVHAPEVVPDLQQDPELTIQIEDDTLPV